MRRFAASCFSLLALTAGLAIIPAADAAPYPSPASRYLPARTALHSPPSQGRSVMSIEDYQERLRAAAQSLSPRREADARRVAESLAVIDTVRMPDGTEVRPRLSPVISALEARPPDIPRAEAGLRALLGELSRSSPPATAPDWGNARARLTEILARPEFNSKPKADPIAEQIGRLRAAALERLRAILRPVLAATAGWDLTSLRVVLGLVLVGGVILLSVRGLRRTLGPDVAVLAPPRGARAVDADSARAEADELALQGDFRGAVRALYVAVLLRWDELGRLRFNRALTNREVLESVGSAADGESSARLLAPLVERFDRFWYGAVPCSADDYADFLGLAAAAWEAR